MACIFTLIYNSSVIEYIIIWATLYFPQPALEFKISETGFRPKETKSVQNSSELDL